MKNNNYKVYAHINRINNKIYIGITKQKVIDRWGKNGNRYKDSKYFWNAINKYGWDNFEHEIIAEHLTKDEACNFEITLIKILNSQDDTCGYNISKGGDGGGYEVSKETRKKMSKAKKGKLNGKNNPMYGVSPKERMNEETYNNWLHKHKNPKENGFKYKTSKVICLTTNEVFDSITEASNKYSIQDGDISSCCLRKLCSAGKHPITKEKMVWQYYVDYLNGVSPIKNTHERQVVCYNNKEIFSTIVEAGDRYSILPSTILLCCQRKYKYAGSDDITGERLIWQYLEDYENGIEPQHVRKIKCINTNEVFDTTSDAAIKYNIKYKTNIVACCNGRAKSAGKHPVSGEKLIWQYI